MPADHQIAQAAQDAYLQYIADNADRVIMTDAAPANYADATTNNGTGSGVKIAEKAVTAVNFTLGAGSPDGREIAVDAFNTVPVAAAGTGSHMVVVDDSGAGKILLVTPLATPRGPLTTSDTVNFPTWDHTIAVPVAAA